MIRILLADDQDLLCEILQTSLESEPDLQIVGQANNGQIALEKIDLLRPDIVLIDINMPVMDGLTATEKIVQDFPETKVIVLSGSEGGYNRTHAIRAGARSYISKTAKTSEIIEQIRLVAQEDIILDLNPGIAEAMSQLNQTKQEIQNYVRQVELKLNKVEQAEIEIKKYFGFLKSEHGELAEEIKGFRADLESVADDVRQAVKESKQHSTEINRIQTLVEGQLSYVHELNKRLKYFRKYTIAVSAVTVVALIIAVIGLLS